MKKMNFYSILQAVYQSIDGWQMQTYPVVFGIYGTSCCQKGFIKGSMMGAARILRCNPFSKQGYDPVKDDLKGNAKWLL